MQHVYSEDRLLKYRPSSGIATRGRLLVGPASILLFPALIPFPKFF